MKIKYNIKIKNPVKEFLKVTETQRTTGSFSIIRKDLGILLEGLYSNGTVVKQAHDYSYLGETFSLNQRDTLDLKEEDVYSLDFETLFSLIDTTVDNPVFQKYQSIFKKVNRTASGFSIENFVEKSTDVLLLLVTTGGTIRAVDGYVQPYSNTLKLASDLEPEGTLLYTLVNKPLKVDTNGFLFLPQEDLVKIPQGFCTLTNDVYTVSSSTLEQKDAYYVLTSAEDALCTFSTDMLIDGVKRTSANIRRGEKLILEPVLDYTPLRLNNRKENILLIYEVLENGDCIPYLAMDNVTEYKYSTSKATLLKAKTLLKADEEFLKKFLVKEYKIDITTKFNKYSSYNTSVATLLLETEDFSGLIVKQ